MAPTLRASCVTLKEIGKKIQLHLGHIWEEIQLGAETKNSSWSPQIGLLSPGTNTKQLW